MDKNLGGRPPKPTKEVANEIALNYYESCKANSQMPFVEELCILLDITRETLSKWQEEIDGFSDTIKKLAILQALMLQKQGMSSGKPTMEIFLLKANHGMTESSELRMKGELGVTHYGWQDSDNSIQPNATPENPAQFQE